MKFEDEVMFYLSKGRIYEGFDIFEDGVADEKDVEKCPECGEKNCKCEAGKTLTIKVPRNGFTPEELEILKRLGAKPANGSVMTGTVGGDDDDDVRASVKTKEDEDFDDEDETDEDETDDKDDDKEDKKAACKTEKKGLFDY